MIRRLLSRVGILGVGLGMAGRILFVGAERQFRYDGAVGYVKYRSQVKVFTNDLDSNFGRGLPCRRND